MRHKYIIANWKMNLNFKQSLELANSFLNFGIQTTKDKTILIAANFTVLNALADVLDKKIDVISQDVSQQQEAGSYTGEVSIDNVLSTGAIGSIIGHSERRVFYGETNHLVNKKIMNVYSKNALSVLCIGENMSERNDNKTFKVIENQLEESFKNIKVNDNITQKIIIAYEPVWAISGFGGKVDPKVEDMIEQIRFIRGWIAKNWGRVEANEISILYGGSISDLNAQTFSQELDIDGFLVGSASLNTEKFKKIVESI